MQRSQHFLCGIFIASFKVNEVCGVSVTHDFSIGKISAGYSRFCISRMNFWGNFVEVKGTAENL